MTTTTEELRARMRQLNFPSDEGGGAGGGPGFSPSSPSPGSIQSGRGSRPRPNLGLGGTGDPFVIGSPISRRPTPGSLNLGAPLSRDRPKFIGSFAQQVPSQDQYERQMEEIMKQSGMLNIDGKKYPTPIENLIPLGDLGNGTCGHVVKMRHKESGKIVACKQMRRTGNSEETKRIVMDMDVVLKSHDCQEIVVCLGCFITASDVWICMELMATCFDKLLKLLKSPVPENICGKVAVATLNALNYLKDKHGVIHRDVKPSNILLDYEGKVKLCDFGISGRLVDSKAKTRSAGCAAYMAPERINPPNPNKPDYDIRADVWSLGITLVELATGQFPYKDCKTEFEVLTKVIQEDPPCLPPNQGFSTEFREFVHDCLLKNHKDRPKYKKLLEYPFITKYRDMEVDVGAWYSKVSNHGGDPNKTSQSTLPSSSPARKSSLEQRHEPQTFKPQPSPRMVKSWRQPSSSSSTSSVSQPPEQEVSPFSRLKFYTKPSPSSPREDSSPRYSDNPRLAELSRFSRDTDQTASNHNHNPRFDPRTGGSYLPTNHESSRLTNGSVGLSRNNFTSSYHGTAASSLLSRPSYVTSRSHEAETCYTGLTSPPASSRLAQGSYSETNSPRDYGHSSSSATHRKYSFETLEPGVGRDYHYTPKGTRKYDSKSDYDQTSSRKLDSVRLESPQTGPGGRERRHPALPVPDTTRGRDPTRDTGARPSSSSSSFMPSSWKFGSWTLSSPLNLRKFRTSSSDRASSNFERNRRLQPGYRSLNERDKQFYSSSGKSDNL